MFLNEYRGGQYHKLDDVLVVPSSQVPRKGDHLRCQQGKFEVISVLWQIGRSVPVILNVQRIKTR